MLARRVNGNPLTRLRQEMDQLFDGYFQDAPTGGALGVRTFPPLNMWDDESKLYVEAELPGLKMDDIELLVSGKELTLKGHCSCVENEQASFHRRERLAGQFNRIVQLPLDVDADKVTAQLKDGVLLITLPKAEAVRPRRIEVKS